MRVGIGSLGKKHELQSRDKLTETRATASERSLGPGASGGVPFREKE